MHYFQLLRRANAAALTLGLLAGPGYTGAHRVPVGSPHPAPAPGAPSVTPRQATFKISIFRQYPNARCTSGYLAVNGTIICYTLEKPWKDNAQNISSIPAGTYPGLLRYDHKDHWRVQLQGTEPRTKVQIHIGNSLDDTIGCILVGDKLTPDLCGIVAGTSTTAYAKLKDAFYGTATPNATPDKKIVVEILGSQPSVLPKKPQSNTK